MRWGWCAGEISRILQQQSELWRQSGTPDSEARAKKHTHWENFCLSSPAAKEHWQLHKQQPSCASTSHLNTIKSNYSTQTFSSYWITCWGTWKWQVYRSTPRGCCQKNCATLSHSTDTNHHGGLECKVQNDAPCWYSCGLVHAIKIRHSKLQTFTE